MRPIPIMNRCAGLLFIFIPLICLAGNQNSPPILFQGQINADNINIRSDSTVSAKIICIAHKGEAVEVVRESYEWYKIRLPKTAPSFIKKNLVTLFDEKTGKVIKDNVNIRLEANESSVILGQAENKEVINIIEDRRGWYKIEPMNNSFGWVNKKFVDKVDNANKIEVVELTQETKKENKIANKKISPDEGISFEGIIKPYGKVIKRIATHKLITLTNKVFLLKGNKSSLDSLNYHKVRVTGKVISRHNQKYTVIEILKIEALD